MQKLSFLIVCALLFVAVMALLVRELADIVKYPEKHADIPGWKHYRRSFWYEHPSRHRRMTSKHYWASLLIVLPLFSLGGFAIWAGGLWLQKALFIPEDVMQLKTEGVTAAMIPGIFWLIGLAAWLSYHSTHPIAIAMSQYWFGGKRHIQKLKASVLMVITTALFIPAMALGLGSYGYATEEGFVVSRYFSVAETRSAYGDCTAQTTWRFNRSEDECYFYYTVTLSDGTAFDLFEACKSGGVDWVHQRLTEAGVALHRSDIDAGSWAVMHSIEPEERLAWLRIFFEVETT